MAYGQKNYLEIQGIHGRYRIDQIGCFLTAFCNLLERFGVQEISPLDLNNIFVSRGIYIDVDDGVRDDLGWQSITAYNGQIVVTATGAGVPPTNNAIIKVHYRSISNPTLPNGQPNMIDHFCLVEDAHAGTIIDSWDGQVKSWNVYGGPVAWAAYANTTPQPVQTPPPAPVAAPAAPVDVSGKALFLPSASGTWRVYPLGGPYSVGHEKGKLATGANPPGMTYPILGVIATHIYKIHTDDWQDVAIYAGPDTIAQFVNIPAPAAPTAPPAATPPAPTPPAPDPTPAPVADPVPAPLQIVDNSGTSAVPTAPAGPLDWKLTYKVNDAGKYEAISLSPVRDLEGVKPDLTILGGQKVQVAGSFEKDGQKYYRPASSVEKNTWYGIPVEDVRPLDESHDSLDQELAHLDLKLEGEKLLKSLDTHEKIVAFVAKAQGFVIRFFRTVTFKNKNIKK